MPFNRLPSRETLSHERIAQPGPEEIEAARLKAGFSQGLAAELISPASNAPYKAWASYEVVDGQNKRAIPLATWELFLLLTDQHPTLRVGEREGDVQADETQINPV